MKDNEGKYLLIVDGSIPMGNPGFSTIAGISNYDMLVEAAKGAAAIVSVGTCAAYGGIPKADPNPTGAVSVSDIIKDKPIINVPGCPPIPVVMTGVLTHFLTFGELPDWIHWAAQEHFMAKRSTTAATVVPSTTRANLQKPSTMKRHAMAGVCSNLAVKGR